MQTHALVLKRARSGRCSLQSLKAIEDVDLLGSLALGLELGQCLDRARLNSHETVEFKDTTQHVQDVHLNDASLGEPFGET